MAQLPFNKSDCLVNSILTNSSQVAYKRYYVKCILVKIKAYNNRGSSKIFLWKGVCMKFSQDIFTINFCNFDFCVNLFFFALSLIFSFHCAKKHHMGSLWCFLWLIQVKFAIPDNFCQNGNTKSSVERSWVY